MASYTQGVQNSGIRSPATASLARHNAPALVLTVIHEHLHPSFPKWSMTMFSFSRHYYIKLLLFFQPREKPWPSGLRSYFQNIHYHQDIRNLDRREFSIQSALSFTVAEQRVCFRQRATGPETPGLSLYGGII